MVAGRQTREDAPGPTGRALRVAARWSTALLLGVMGVVALTSGVAVHAQPAPPLATPAAAATATAGVSLDVAPTAPTPAPMAVLQGLGPEVGIDAVAAMDPARFEPLVAGKVYRLSADRVLWMRLWTRASAPLPEARVLLEFPSVVIDRYEVYQRGADGGWRMMVAGDRLPHREWPLDSLRPRFPLTAAVAGEQPVFVRVFQEMPSSFKPTLVAPEQATERDAQMQLWAGLLLGAGFTLLLGCVQMAWAYRDHTYVWYGGYLVSTLMAALCYTGIAQRELWPDASKFASDAVVLFVMLAFAFNLMFAQAMFGGYQRRLGRRIGQGIALACLAYASVTLARQHYGGHVWMFNVLVVAVVGYLIVLALQAWWRGVRFGGYWLAIYVPYLLTIGAVLVDSTGIVAFPWLPSPTPVLAAVVEVTAMMLCINAYGRLRHAQEVHEQVAALHDPLTGFLREAEFRRRAAKMWQAAGDRQRDVAVVLVQVEPAEEPADTAMAVEALMAHSVRMVRVVAREQDLVGRLRGQQLALLLIDAAPGPVLQQRLSRLIALGLMRDAHNPAAQPIRFRLAVGLRSTYPGTYDALERELQALLAPPLAPGRAAADTQRALRFLNPEVAVRRVAA